MRNAFQGQQASERRQRGHSMTQLQPTLGWDVEQLPITIKGVISKEYKAIGRADNSEVLNIVKKSYVPLLNTELMQTVNRLSEFTNLKVAGYSEFDGGRKIIASLQAAEARVGDWPINLNMIIINSHDYTSAFAIGTASTLIRCTNQFSQISRNMKIQHTKSAEFKREELESYFKLYQGQSNMLLTNMEKMMKVPATRKLGNDFMNHVLDIKGSLEDASMKKRNQRTELEGAIRREIADVGNNLFGLFNGLTYYSTHEKKLKSGYEKAYGNVLGSMATLNNRGYEFAIAHI